MMYGVMRLLSKHLIQSIVVVGFMFSGLSQASTNGIPGYSHSETGSSSCHDCHNQSMFASSNTNVTLTGDVNVLVGSLHSYHVLVSASSSTTGKFSGFNLSASAGNLSSADAETSLINNEIVHSNKKATIQNGSRYDVSWLLNWQAPSIPGYINMDVCGLPVNGDGKSKGFFGGYDGKTACTRLLINVMQAPTADAGPNQTVDEGLSVNLNAMASSDDGTLTYVWSQLSGTPVSLANNTLSVTSFTAPNQASGITEELVFQITVTDNDGLMDTDQMSVFVQDVIEVNMAPVANAGVDKTANEGVVVTLDGSASYDDVSIIRYFWQQVSGVNAVALNDASLVAPTFTSPQVDVTGDLLEFQLTVTDREGVSSTDNILVTINNVNKPPQAKITDASGVVITAISNNGDVTLYGNYSSDPDGNITAYSWSQTAGTAISNPGATNQLSFQFTTPDDPGSSIDIQLIVTGDQGVMTDPVTITLLLDDLAPVINITDNFTVIEGESIALTAQISDGNNDLISVQWRQLNCTSDCVMAPRFIDLPLANNEALTYALSPTVTTANKLLEFEVTATDSKSATATASLQVTVVDNGINGFPEGTTSFLSHNLLPMAISVDSIGGDPVYVMNLAPISSAVIADVRNKPEVLPYHMLDISMQLSNSTVTEPASVWINLYFLDAIDEATHLYEYLSTFGWMNVTTSRDFDFMFYTDANGWSEKVEAAEISSDRKSVRLRITDGGPSDADGVVNGVVNMKVGQGKNKPVEQEQPGATGAIHEGLLLMILFVFWLRYYQAAGQSAV